MTDRPPQLAKRIVYLDQWALSEMANSLDPVLRARKGARVDGFWLELYRQLERLVKLHVIVCPVSPLHEREALITPYGDVHRALRGHLAGDVRLQEPFSVHSRQLYFAFDEEVRGRPAPPNDDAQQWAIASGSTTAWLDRIRISAHFPDRPSDVARQRAIKDGGDSHLGADFAKWQQQPGRPFRAWFDYHRRDLTDAVLHCFTRGLPGSYGEMCRVMAARLVEDGATQAEAAATVETFLRSDAATRVPYCEISGLLYAAMSRKAADGGQKSPIDHGHYYDVHAIAAYLPYCDAICVDGYFAEILRSGDVKRRVTKHHAKVFCAAEKDAFFSYLEGLETQAPAELKAVVSAVYGEDWLRPYEGVLEYERRKANEI
jgi:hypothetical protein